MEEIDAEVKRATEPETVFRECYECIYCEMVYPDAPVTQCDCLGFGNPEPHFYKGKIEYEKRIEK